MARFCSSCPSQTALDRARPLRLLAHRQSVYTEHKRCAEACFFVVVYGAPMVVAAAVAVLAQACVLCLPGTKAFNAECGAK